MKLKIDSDWNVTGKKRHNTPRWRALSLIYLVSVLFSILSSVQAATLPADLRSVLTDTFKFTNKDLEDVESGRPVAKFVSGNNPGDLRLVGIVLIETSSKRAIEAYKDIVHFETGKEVLHTGKFSNPPKESDLAGFRIPDFDKKEFLACHPGKCAYKLPASVIEDLQQHINWSAPDAEEQVNRRVRKLWIEYLNRYREQGNAALAVYYDTPEPFSVADGLRQIMNGLGSAHEKIPDLMLYLAEYPKGRPPNTEDFFYWQEAAFGLKPVVRTSHVIIQRIPGPGDSTYFIASKMLFATHYFRAALELKWLDPVNSESGRPAVYFLTYQHSYVDGMNGLSGAFLRHIVPGRTRKSLIEKLRQAKEQLENGENK